jgi:hypothetical protein
MEKFMINSNSISTPSNISYTIPTENKRIFGVWIPGEGWLKGKDVFADTDLEKVQQVARLIGRGATVRFIDKAIIDLEHRYLEQERRSLWQKIKSLISLKEKKI